MVTSKIINLLLSDTWELLDLLREKQNAGLYYKQDTDFVKLAELTQQSRFVKTKSANVI